MVEFPTEEPLGFAAVEFVLSSSSKLKDLGDDDFARLMKLTISVHNPSGEKDT